MFIMIQRCSLKVWAVFAGIAPVPAKTSETLAAMMNKMTKRMMVMKVVLAALCIVQIPPKLEIRANAPLWK